MAILSSQVDLSKWFVLIISIVSTTIDGRAPKGTIKTIESCEDGELIDCVDIFKQPAFDNPLLKNYTTQVFSPHFPKAKGAEFVEDAFNQSWWKYGECPEGTIPIRRPQKHDNHHLIPLTKGPKQLNLSGNNINLPPGRHEYAAVGLTHGIFLGARATINVWNPTVIQPEVSFSQIWVQSGTQQNLNTVEAGWMVDTISTPRNQARIFIFYTKDNYRTSCYYLQCDGFIQTNKRFSLGSPLLPVSNYGGQQYDITIAITKNQVTGDWWLRIGVQDVGFWPRRIFTSLGGPADTIYWGGEIVNTAPPGGRHTSSQMGSGHFPTEGFGRASYFRHIKFVDSRSIERDPENLVRKVTRPECYDLLLNVEPRSTVGVNFYYGGPGYSGQQCARS